MFGLLAVGLLLAALAAADRRFPLWVPWLAPIAAAAWVIVEWRGLVADDDSQSGLFLLTVAFWVGAGVVAIVVGYVVRAFTRRDDDDPLGPSEPTPTRQA